MENSIIERLRIAIEYLKKVGSVDNQADIAHRVGYKRAQTISDMLQGKVTITTKFVIVFCKEFGIDEHWLTTGEGDILPEVSAEKNTQSEEPKTIMRKAKEYFSGLRDILREDGDFTELNKEEAEAREALSKAENEFYRALIKKMEDISEKK